MISRGPFQRQPFCVCEYSSACLRSLKQPDDTASNLGPGPAKHSVVHRQKHVSAVGGVWEDEAHSLKPFSENRHLPPFLQITEEGDLFFSLNTAVGSEDAILFFFLYANLMVKSFF